MSGSRKGRGESRNAQAFRALLEDDHDSSAIPGRRRSSKGSKGVGRPIVLRDEQGQRAVASTGPVQDLLAMFPSLPQEVVEDVYRACNSSLETAVESLLALAGGEQGAVTGGGSGEPTLAAPSPAGEAEAATEAGPCWGWLPEEVKLLVLQQLTVRDLARLAGTCWELARHVREQRRRMRSVTLPEGISMPAVRGAVAAFSHAPAVCLSRWAPHLKFPNQFEDLFAAIALGEADRASRLPIRHIDLSRCGGLTDSDVGTLCTTLRHLDSVDLSRCSQISDGCLGSLAHYASAAVDGEAADLAWDMADMALIGGTDLASSSSAEPLPAAGALDSYSGELASPSTAVKRIAEAKEAARQARRGGRADVLAAASGPAGLRALCLRETEVTWGGVRGLLQGAGSPSSKSLQLLDVSRCRGVGPEGFGLGSKCMLRELQAAGCLRLRSVVLQLPATAQLENVDLSACRQLQEVVVSAGSLRRLSLSHCGVLAALSLKCRSLEELRCVNCSRLPVLGPEFDCPSLRHLDLFGCRVLEAEALEAAVGSFGALERLNLGGCTLLSRLLLAEAAPRLTHVDVSGCGAMRQVVLGSRVLQELTAKGCARLLAVRLHSCALATLDFENCGQLREVTLPAQASTSRKAAPSIQGGGGRPKQPILKGCTALTPVARSQLKAALQ